MSLFMQDRDDDVIEGFFWVWVSDGISFWANSGYREGTAQAVSVDYPHSESAQSNSTLPIQKLMWNQKDAS